MENSMKLVVRNIIGEAINGYVRVTVSNDLFNAVRGLRPSLPYTGIGDQGNNGVRVFNIDGKDLCVRYNKETKKTMFLMKTEDALASYTTLAEERADQPKLPFNSALFETALA